jgi:hypothetical protein
MNRVKYFRSGSHNAFTTELITAIETPGLMIIFTYTSKRDGEVRGSSWLLGKKKDVPTRRTGVEGEELRSAE